MNRNEHVTQSCSEPELLAHERLDAYRVAVEFRALAQAFIASAQPSSSPAAASCWCGSPRCSHASVARAEALAGCPLDALASRGQP